MSDKPRRPWFQIHLSTTVIMMLTAGVLLGLNLSDHTPHVTQSPSQLPEEIYFLGGRGWPFSVQQGAFSNTSVWTKNLPPETVLADSDSRWRYYGTDKVLLAINIGICLIIVLFAGSLLEWRIRRREPRAP